MGRVKTMQCSGKGCSVQVPIGDVAPVDAWCSARCAGGMTKAQAQRPTRPHQSTPATPKRQERVNTAQAPPRPANRTTASWQQLALPA